MKDNLAKDSSLINKTLASAFKTCIPLVTTIEITQTCNFKCKHCYNFDRSKPMPDSIKNNQMDSAQIINAIDQIANLGSLYVNISGGEALAHPHIEDFIKRVKNHNMEPRLKTNGVLLSEEKIERLHQLGLNAVDISLYGSSNESYLSFTGSKNGYDRAIQAIRNCVRLNLEINVNIILHRFNVEELNEMIETCLKLNINYQVSTETTERYDKTKGAREFEITLDQFERLLLGKHGHLFMVNNKERALQCSCARSVCGIGSNGDIYPCIGAPIISGNLKNEKLSTVWKESKVLNEIRELKEDNFKECQSCDFIEYCSRSSGTCHVNGNGYTGCDPSFINQAKIRFKHKDHFNINDSDV